MITQKEYVNTNEQHDLVSSLKKDGWIVGGFPCVNENKYCFKNGKGNHYVVEKHLLIRNAYRWVDENTGEPECT